VGHRGAVYPKCAISCVYGITPAPTYCYDVGQVRTQRFTARIGHGVSIAEDVTYDELVDRLLEYVVRAAIAKANDYSTWEEEELRREGLRGVEFVKDGRALWWDQEAFDAEKAEAKRERAHEIFRARNEFAGTFFEALDGDLREKLRRAGYATTALFTDMRELFREIAADASDRTAQAREGLVSEILSS
jgi:hypothetical protein